MSTLTMNDLQMIGRLTEQEFTRILGKVNLSDESFEGVEDFDFEYIDDSDLGRIVFTYY